MPAANNNQLTGDLQTVLTAAAFAPVAPGRPASSLVGVVDRAFLRITGPDAPRWLNGMVTNNIQALNPGQGNYNFLLNAQGRIQGDCTIYSEPTAGEPAFLLETDAAQLDIIQQLLDKFIIMDDVELTPGLPFGASVLNGYAGTLLIGPHSTGLVTRMLTLPKDFAPLQESPSSSLTLASFEGHQVFLLTPTGTAVPTFEIWCADRSVSKELLRTFDFYKIPQLSPETLEQLRILEARPRFGTDIRNTDVAKDLPQETNQPHALHFAKGCYLGQEIVERIRSRGQVHRLFIPFRLEGTLPTTLPVPLKANDKPAGELTSAISVPTTEGPVHLALGYARREFLDSLQGTNTPFLYTGGTAHPRSPGNLT